MTDEEANVITILQTTNQRALHISQYISFYIVELLVINSIRFYVQLSE